MQVAPKKPGVKLTLANLKDVALAYGFDMEETPNGLKLKCVAPGEPTEWHLRAMIAQLKPEAFDKAYAFLVERKGEAPSKAQKFIADLAKHFLIQREKRERRRAKRQQ